MAGVANSRRRRLGSAVAVGAAFLVSREGHSAPRHRWNGGGGCCGVATLVSAPEPSPRDGLIPDKGGSGRPPLSFPLECCARFLLSATWRGKRASCSLILRSRPLQLSL